MATFYSIEEGENNEIKFWTNNDELYKDVARYIQNCVDAVSYRDRVEQITKAKRGGLL